MSGGEAPSDEPQDPKKRFKPLTKEGVVAVESGVDFHYFLPAVSCSGCGSQESLMLATKPGNSDSHLISEHAWRYSTDYSTTKWKGVSYCGECNQTSDMDLSSENVIEMEAEEWNEYLQYRQRYGMDL